MRGAPQCTVLARITILPVVLTQPQHGTMDDDAARYCRFPTTIFFALESFEVDSPAAFSTSGQPQAQPLFLALSSARLPVPTPGFSWSAELQALGSFTDIWVRLYSFLICTLYNYVPGHESGLRRALTWRCAYILLPHFLPPPLLLLLPTPTTISRDSILGSDATTWHQAS